MLPHVIMYYKIIIQLSNVTKTIARLTSGFQPIKVRLFVLQEREDDVEVRCLIQLQHNKERKYVGG